MFLIVHSVCGIHVWERRDEICNRKNAHVANKPLTVEVVRLGLDRREVLELFGNVVSVVT